MPTGPISFTLEFSLQIFAKILAKDIRNFRMKKRSEKHVSRNGAKGAKVRRNR